MRFFSILPSCPKYSRFLFFATIVCSRSVLPETGFQSLRMGADARSGAMGMTGAAMPGGAGFRNPAGLMLSAGKEAGFSMHRWIQDVKSGMFGLSWSGKSQAVGMHLLYTEAGGIEHRIVPSPEPIGTFSWNECVLGLSYARKWKPLTFGITVKLLYEKIFMEDAWGAAADIGAVYAFGQNGLRVGAAVLNIGGTENLRTESVKIPLTGTIGAAMPFSRGGFDWTAVLDAVLERDEPFHLHGGIEWGVYRRLYVRTGYQTGYDNRNATFGTGVAWGSCRFDYGYMPFKSGLGDSHRLTFGVRW